MRVLVIGSGGREHALVWKITQSKLVDKIFCAPGNAGISRQAECLDIKPQDIPGLLNFAKKEKIGLTVVGPEAPLAQGLVDEFTNYGLKVFGPNKKAAQIESSKVFAKQLMAKYNVPTADFKVFDSVGEATDYIQKIELPCVIKADGLAQGKGVLVAKSVDEAREALKSIMQDRIFGQAGDKVIIEDCLGGEEASIIVITDSKGVIPLATSQDHKRVFDGDQGPNTGGMGAYSPAPIVSQELFNQILKKIIYRIIDGLKKEGINYKGTLYAGIMISKDGPKVLEFNVRFGDPETQVILPRLNSDLVEVMLATTEERLSGSRVLNWDSRACVCVVIASRGYPGDYEKGKEISGLDEVAQMRDIVVFHAGTKKLPVVLPQAQDTLPKDTKGSGSVSGQLSDRYITNGGRVLGVTGLGETIKEARDKTYRAVEKIRFEGMHYRRDIGYRAMGGLSDE